MAEALAQLYFVEGAPLCELETLLEGARRVGLDEADVRRYLGSEEGQGEVPAVGDAVLLIHPRCIFCQ